MPKAKRATTSRDAKFVDPVARMKRDRIGQLLIFLDNLERELTVPHRFGRPDRAEIEGMSKKLTHEINKYFLILSESQSEAAILDMTNVLQTELSQFFSMIRSMLRPVECTLNKLVIAAGTELINTLRSLVMEIREACPIGNKPSPSVVGPVWKCINAIPLLPASCATAAAKQLMQYLITIKDAASDLTKFKQEDLSNASEQKSKSNTNNDMDDIDMSDMDDDDDDYVLNAEEYKRVPGVTNICNLTTLVLKKVASFFLKCQDDDALLPWIEGITARCGNLCSGVDEIICALSPPHELKSFHKVASQMLSEHNFILAELQGSQLFIEHESKNKPQQSEEKILTPAISPSENAIFEWFRNVRSALDNFERNFFVLVGGEVAQLTFSISQVTLH
jgi:hypothetical protein